MLTPCVKLCVLDQKTQTCIGCGRTLAEIGAWTTYTEAERREVMAALPSRLRVLRRSSP